MLDVHAHIPEQLARDAAAADGVPSGLSIPELIRLALAKLAGWPDSAALTVARPRRKDGPGRG